MTRVLLADDHAALRRGVRQELEETGTAVVVAEAENGAQTLAMAREWSSTLGVVVVDLTMEGMDGLEVISRLHAEHPSLPVLAYSSQPASAVGLQVLEAGANGFLNKRAAVGEICRAVTRVSEGRRYVSPELAGLLADRSFGGSGRPTLSVREAQVVRLLAQGRARAEIADQLAIAVTTVSKYKSRAMEKTGTGTDAELIGWAARTGLVE